MATPAIKRFDTEQELTDYADRLNAAGVSPEIPIMDSVGTSALACLQAPGGDGWEFAYYGVNDEDGYIVMETPHDGAYAHPLRCVRDPRDGMGWIPQFPVFGLVDSAGAQE